MRKEFILTEEAAAMLLGAEKLAEADAIWRNLGERLGFDHTTIEFELGNNKFTAEVDDGARAKTLLLSKLIDEVIGFSITSGAVTIESAVKAVIISVSDMIERFSDKDHVAENVDMFCEGLRAAVGVGNDDGDAQQGAGEGSDNGGG